MQKKSLTHSIHLFTFIGMLGQQVCPSLAAFLHGQRRALPLALARRDMSFFEVEQKFRLTSNTTDLEEKLEKLGFFPRGTITFVDWYFDTQDVTLSIRDCWLRFREEQGSRGVWQLKEGRGDADTTTVYHEVEGQEAVTKALSLLPKNDSNQSVESTIYEGFTAPKLPGGDYRGLSPFCRLETRRSSWITKSEKGTHSGLVVDLDATNTDFSVGEVEAVAADDASVAHAKKRVQSLIAELTGATSFGDGPAIGKLEHYLINHRSEHYNACLQSGSMKEKS
jgi:hypothetical protein